MSRVRLSVLLVRWLLLLVCFRCSLLFCRPLFRVVSAILLRVMRLAVIRLIRRGLRELLFRRCWRYRWLFLTFRTLTRWRRLALFRRVRLRLTLVIVLFVLKVRRLLFLIRYMGRTRRCLLLVRFRLVSRNSRRRPALRWFRRYPHRLY